MNFQTDAQKLGDTLKKLVIRAPSFFFVLGAFVLSKVDIAEGERIAKKHL